jgi:hypothetical protein
VRYEEPVSYLQIRLDYGSGQNIAAGRIDFFVRESTYNFDAYFYSSFPRSNLSSLAVIIHEPARAGLTGLGRNERGRHPPKIEIAYLGEVIQLPTLSSLHVYIPTISHRSPNSDLTSMSFPTSTSYDHVRNVGDHPRLPQAGEGRAS